MWRREFSRWLQSGIFAQDPQSNSRFVNLRLAENGLLEPSWPLAGGRANCASGTEETINGVSRGGKLTGGTLSKELRVALDDSRPGTSDL